MSNLVPIFVVGIIVLGIYKLFELFVKRQERLLLIEKLPVIFEKREGGKINLPELIVGTQNYGFGALRVALLLMGVGVGCIVALLVEYGLFDAFLTQEFSRIDNWRHVGEIQFVLYFSFITIFGGTGLFVAYLLEQKYKGK
ncbi:hypothetical protein SAMD00024442_35_22 [Candidatus Symbiothrix dinenymphae]|nr:hypothetical protein SAMD00024442_35_22 [Candidatus Symbiothrix dinenymphae]